MWKFAIPVIFTTAYDEHAIKAFKLNSINFPVRSRFDENELETALINLRTSSITVLIKAIPTILRQLLSLKTKNSFLIARGKTIII